jgi:hypothetical protein
MKQLILYCLLVSGGYAQEHLYDYTIFANSRMTGNYFFSKTTAQYPSSIKNENQRLPVNNLVFHTPGSSLQLEYVNGKNGNWDASIFKETLRTQDHYKPAEYFTFSIYTSSNTNQGDLPVCQLIMRDSSRSSKVKFSTHKKNTWEVIQIPVSSFKEININTPMDIMGVSFSQGNKGGGKHTIYLDDIEFLPSTVSVALHNKPTILSCVGYAKHVDISWKPVSDEKIKYVKVYRSQNGSAFKPVGIQLPLLSHYVDYTGETGKKYSYKISFLDYQFKETGYSNIVSAATKAMTDEELLTMVQEGCFRYYWECAEKTSGMANENILGRTNMIAVGASGFGVMAILAGTERKFITRKQSVERFIKILDFLERAEKFHGAFAHFIDGPTGKVEPLFGSKDNGGDLVETSFLFEGLLTARQYFNQQNEDEKKIREKITALWQNVEWDWYRRSPDSKYLYWHWSPDQAWVINHRLTGWNETMVTYLLAIASPTHSVPASLYYSGWANQDSTGQQYRQGWGGTTEGSMYTNGNTYYGIKLDVGVSNGGPLFFTHYSYLGYDPHMLTDKYTNYFINNRNISLINYRYCVKNPNNFKGYGENSWGLTACDGPFDYYPSEPVQGRNDGTIAPTGALSSMVYTPAESMKALKNYYYNYGKFLWGEYGFRDAFNLSDNWCSGIYMGLNQGPIAAMIENYRTGLLWKLFMSNPDIQAGLKKLEAERPVQ